MSVGLNIAVQSVPASIGSGHKGPQPVSLYRRPERIEMDDPIDPADTTFQRLLNREILVSERRRMLILAGLLAFILVLILCAVTFAPGLARSMYQDRLPVRATLVAFPAFIAYELFAATLLTIFLRHRRNFPIFGRYVNALVETSFPTVLLYLLAGYLSASVPLRNRPRRVSPAPANLV
jgi:hypothetical protein